MRCIVVVHRRKEKTKAGVEVAIPNRTMEARVRIELTREGFADLSLATWVPRREESIAERERSFSARNLAPEVSIMGIHRMCST